MNYFEFYELPVRFHPDQAEVKKKFYALSKKYHPDFYVNQPPETQQEVLDLSTLNNKAYQALGNTDRLLSYVLELKGLLPDDEHYTLPQDFLMEMMEVNETIMDLQFERDEVKLAGVNEAIASREGALNAELSRLTSQYDEHEDDSLLPQIKDLYFRGKYLNRIKESLSKLP